MFKNPLKYQSGGSTPTQQQQDQLVQLFQAAAQNAQVDPEALVKKAQEFGQDENAAAQFMEGLQRCAQGDPAGIQFIKSLFTSSHKRGGKIQDFICKHGKGGVAGCDCEKPVLKGQEAIPGGMPRFQAPTNYYNEKGWPLSERDALRRNNRTFYTEEPTTAGNLAWTNNQMASQLMWPGIIQDVQYNQPVGHYIDEYGNMHNFAVQGEDLTRYNNRKAQWKGDGGKVEKAQNGKPELGYDIVDYRDSRGVGRTHQSFKHPLTEMYLDTNTREDTPGHFVTDSSFTHFMFPNDVVLGSVDKADKTMGIVRVKDANKYRDYTKVWPFLRNKWNNLTNK